MNTTDPSISRTRVKKRYIHLIAIQYSTDHYFPWHRTHTLRKNATIHQVTTMPFHLPVGNTARIVYKHAGLGVLIQKVPITVG